MFKLLERNKPVPQPVSKPQPRKITASSEAVVAEYTRLAESVGYLTPELTIQKFQCFLEAHDLPTYDLRHVVAYMDALAKQHNHTKQGWEWVPLRRIDRSKVIIFGRSELWYPEYAASDRLEVRNAEGTLYERLVPSHALKRVALIDEAFGTGTVVFAVSDYATRRNPDPFLMAMIPNNRLGEGVGRYVIDVWDEPGFGAMDMLNAAPAAR